MPSLVFKDAEQARDSICIEDQRKIRDLYAEWADKVAERAEFYEKKTTASSYWQQQQMLELERQLRSQSMQIHKEIEAKSKSSMYMVADSVVGCNAEFLKTLGFKEEGINAAFTSVPNRVVSNIVTGQIYKSGWSLSKAIWTDNQKTLSDIYSIVAQGRAMNMSAYEVSKMLERYVSPSRKMQWNLKMRDGAKIYKKTVDYNAQRLVRTLNQHAYQQSVIQVAKDNPFIQGIYWRANGSRVCPLCMDRDGNFYKWNEVPMDHPNGMCTMEPAIDMDKTIDQLADWIKEPDGTYPEIDKFAEKLGYEPTPAVINAGLPNEQKINSAHYVAQGKDITDIWKRRPEQFDFEIEDVISAQGFDGKPRVVSKEEFDKAVKAANGGNGFIAQRTYSAPNQETLDAYREQLYNGKWYVDCSTGGSVFGQGMYCAGDYGFEITGSVQNDINQYQMLALVRNNFAETYNNVETLTISPDAKIVKYTAIKKQMEDESYSGDVGVYATLKGYDVIDVNVEREKNSFVILNRTKLIIDGGD